MKNQTVLSLLAIFCINLLLVTLDFCWFSFDHRIWSMDEAGHVMSCLDMQQKLNHIRFDFKWWHELMTVNQLYPPAFYLTGGFFRLLFKHCDWIDLLVMQFFKVVLWTSIYFIGRMSGFGIIASCLCILALSSFPLVSVLSHSIFLEIPLLAGVALAMLALLYWYEKRQSKYTYLNMFFAGLAIGFACLIKQPAGYFLIAPAAYLTLKPETDKKYYLAKLAQAAGIALIAAIVFLPWFLTNVEHFNYLVQKNVQAFHQSNSQNSFFDYLIPYLNAFPRSMSPVLFVTFVFGIFALDKKLQSKILPFTLSSISGIILLSTFTASENLSRYIIPALLAPALYIGALIGVFLLQNEWWKKAIASIFLIVVLLQNFSFSYFPYPCGELLPAPVSESITGFSKSTKTFNSCPAGQLDWSKDNPMSKSTDWGQKEVIQTIKKQNGNNPVWLNIMVNSGPLNARTFTYLCRIENVNINCSTSRVWTITGDKVTFDQNEINRYDWYLFKDKDSGYRFVDQSSSLAAQQIREYVENSKDFQLESTIDLPDKTHLKLYRNVAHAK